MRRHAHVMLVILAVITAGLVIQIAPISGQSRPRVAYLYEATETTGPIQITTAVGGLPVDVTVFAAGASGTPLADDTDLGTFDVLVVDTGMSGFARLAPRVRAAAARTRVVALGAGASIPGSVELTSHPWIAEYWANASQDNYRRLTAYLVARVLGNDVGAGDAEPPIVYPDQAFYHPDAPALFETLEAYIAWYSSPGGGHAHHVYDPEQLTVGVHLHLTSYQQKNVAHIDAIIRTVEARGANVIPLAAGRGPRLVDVYVRGDDPVIDVLLFSGERLDSGDLAAGRAQAQGLNVPVLGSIVHFSMTEEAFRAAPNGLHPSMTARVVGSEQDGLIEPLVVAGRGTPFGDRSYVAPFAAQVEWRVQRALAWARLHRLANRDKRVVFTFWSQGGGKANVGADPDDFLDVPASLLTLFRALEAQGYDVGDGPLPDRDTLARRMATEASNVGSWAPGELAARVARGEITLVPEATYLKWFEELPDVRRQEIVEMWGPPPGKVMVYTDDGGRKFLAIPTIHFGNMLVAPHPDWGYLQDQKALMSVGALPPHHQYLAFFLWLQKEWKADAWVSVFTNIVLQPGKSEGPAADDHIAYLLGALPNIHPERLGAGGGASNKRKGLAQTVSWYNLVEPATVGAELGELRALMTRYEDQPSAERRAETEAVVRKEVAAQGLDRVLEMDVATVGITDLIAATREYIDSLERASVPSGSKILGDAPEGRVLADMVAGMLGADLRAAIAPLTDAPATAARGLARAVVLEGATPRAALEQTLGRSTPQAEAALATAAEYADRLRAAPREIAGIVDALSAHWIEPGPMDEPMRRPGSVPPGRSLYQFDQAAIPTIEAEAMGVRQAEALIAAHRAKHGGAYPTRLAFVVWSTEIATTHGATEAQILHLLGTRAVRNARGEVTGVELIPREELGRPRVDVLITTSGTYRDHYQDKVDLITDAIRLASASPEPDNPVAAATEAAEEALTASGRTADEAAVLARARVFSPAPGAYSPSIQFLAKSGDQRGDEARMAELYTNRMSHAYGAGLYGESARPLFERSLATMDAATLPRSSHVNGMLDHPMSAGFLGGLNLAAKAVTGEGVDLYVSNLRDPDNTFVETAARSIQTELRSRYFNRAWLETMKQNGYEGARTMMYMTDHLDLWDTTASDTVSSEDWSQVKSVYVDDSLRLDLDSFFERYNPHAQQVLLANLMGAASRGQWQATDAERAEVASRLARSMADHGAVCEAAVCRNPALTASVAAALDGVPGGAELAASYREAIARATTAPEAAETTAETTSAPAAMPAPAAAPAPSVPTAAPPLALESAAAAPAANPVVTGRALETVAPAASASEAYAGQQILWWALASAAVVLFAFGWVRAGSV